MGLPAASSRPLPLGSAFWAAALELAAGSVGGVSAALYLPAPRGALRRAARWPARGARVWPTAIPADADHPVALAWRTQRPTRGPATARGGAPRRGAGSAVLAVPLPGPGAAGVLAVEARAPAARRRAAVSALRRAARACAAALRFGAGLGRAREEAAGLAAVQELAGAITGELDLDRLLRRVVEDAAVLLQGASAALGLRVGAGDEIEIVAATPDLARLVGARISVRGTPCEDAMAQLRPLVANRMSRRRYPGLAAVLDRLGDRGTRSACVAPLRVDGDAIGTLFVWAHPTRRFGKDDARRLDRLAEQAGIAIQNARLVRTLQVGKQEWQETFDSIGDGIALVDRKGRVLRANLAFAALAGRDVRQVVGVPVAELFAGRTHGAAEAPHRLVDEALRTGAGVEAQVELDRPYRVLRAAAYPSARGATLVLKDVTALVALEERHRRIVEAVSDAVVITSGADRRLAFANPAAERLFGLPADRLLGKLVAEFLPDDPALRDAVAREEDRVLGGAVRRYETVIRRPTGELRAVAVSSAPLRERDRVVGTVAVLQDVTEAKALRERMAQTEKLAALGQLLSGVAHELNNPLAAISSFAQVLAEAPEGAAQAAELGQQIRREAERAARIVRNLLRFARPQAPTRERVDLARVLDEVLGLHALELDAGAVEVERAYGPGLFVDGDPHALAQVFLNLVLNAQQAMAGREGPRRLEVRAARSGDRIAVEVADTGPGIAPEDLGRIFDPFFTTKAPGEGTGLGLTVTYGIVRDHGGRIEAANRPEGGAVFRVELPAARPGAPEAPRPDREARRAAAAEPEAPLSVLVIDDEPAIRRSVSAYLRRRGHSVEVAGTGREALERLRAGAYDVVFCDLRMPDLDGPRLFDRLAEERPDALERIVFVTGDTVQPEIQEFLARAGRPCIMKPFDLEELERRARDVAARTAGGKAPPGTPDRAGAGT